MDTLKFPLSFSKNREISKVTEGTDDYIRQMLSVCILTEPFILPLTPDFGVADPSFSTLSPATLMLNVAKYIPEVSLVAVDSLLDESAGTIKVRFIYNR